jgi:hypothetical protein
MVFDTKFSELGSTFGVEFDNVVTTVIESDDVPRYSGDYDVTPRVGEQVLPTRNKLMIDDMTIKAIPVYKVSNTSGGVTVYIANEV